MSVNETDSFSSADPVSATDSPVVDQASVGTARQEIRQLVAEIAGMARSETEPEQFYETLLTKAVSALAAVGGAVWELDDEGTLELV